MAYDYSDEEARLQKKLIPVNIVVCILCLVAAISLVFAPLLTIDLTQMKEVLVELVQQESGNNGGYEDGSDPDSSNSEEIDFESMFESLDGTISITALDIGKFAFSEGSVIMPVVIDLMKGMMVPAMSQAIVEQLNLDPNEVDFSRLNDKFEAFNHVESKEEMSAAAEDLIDELIRLSGEEINDANKQQAIDTLVEYYERTVEVAGEFDLEKMVCVIASDEIFELETPITSYEQLFEIYMNEAGDEETGSAYEMLKMADEALKTFAKGVFWMVMFPAITWLILFLFSLLHMLARNKRFVMWYVKLFGGIPWFVFGLIPMTMGGIITSIGEEAAIVGSLFGAISSMTWISGVCLILLWLVSIFWAHPIKKKIRRERNT